MADINKMRKLSKACGIASAAVILELLGQIYERESYLVRCNGELIFRTADFLKTEEEATK